MGRSPLPSCSTCSGSVLWGFSTAGESTSGSDMKRNGIHAATGVALALLWLAAAAYGQQARTPKRNPLVRVVTISQDRATQDENGSLLGVAMERLNQAASFQPDIACLPELFARSAAES